MEFSVKEIINLLIKRLKWIILCLFAGLVIFFAFSKYIIDPSYTAYVQLYVIPNDTDSTYSLNELNYAQKVVTTYINFLNTNVFYKKIQDECKLDYTVSKLKNMTTIKTVNDTEIFEISVTTSSAKNSYLLVEAMQRIAPELIQSIKPTAKISIVDPVTYPTRPSSPNIFKNTLLGGIFGVFISILVAFLWEIFDINVKNKEDLFNNYNLPVIGEIPNFNLESKKKLSHIYFPSIIKKHNLYPKIDNSQINNSKFIIAESYKALRTNLRFTLPKEDCKKIIICSPVPEEGKSTTSINLGITISQTGSKVLLIDCDLRKGKIHSYFNLKFKPGLSEILSGMMDVKEVIRKTSYENLNVITIGAISPNPTELLSSTQMEEIIKRLETEYDFIIFDTPPVNVLSDSLSLVKLSDGLILVARIGITSHPNISSALEKFKLSHANILGFVINGVNYNNSAKSKYYYYHNGDKND